MKGKNLKRVASDEWREGATPVQEWEEYPHTPGVFVRAANKGVAGYGTWKRIRKTKRGDV
jgi:hypothetical protein